MALTMQSLKQKIESCQTQIRDLEHKIQQHSEVLKNLKSFLNGLLTAKELMGKKLPESTPLGTDHHFRSGSNVSRAAELLGEEKRPMHMDEILEKLRLPKSKKVSLASSFSKSKNIFKNLGKNVFQLVSETSSKEQQSQ